MDKIGKNGKFTIYLLTFFIAISAFYIGWILFSKNRENEKSLLAKPDKIDENFIDYNYEEYNKIQKEMEEFSFESFEKLIKSDSNIIYSPFSYQSAMGLLCASSGEESKKIIEKGLRLSNFEAFEKNYKVIVANLKRGGKSEVFNSIWLEKDIKPNTETIKKSADNFYSHFYKADFSKKSTYEKMSKLVEENTKGKLKFDEKDTEPNKDTAVIFLNTVYTKVAWKKPFDEKNTKKGEFKTSKEKTDVDFMKGKEKAFYFKNENYEIGKKNFQEEYSALFIKPIGKIDEVLKRESLKEAVEKFNKNKDQCDLTLHLPKFNIFSKLSLKEMSEDMGMGEIFKNINIKPIGEMKLPSRVSKIIQGVCVSMDEKGTEAAAYTRVDVEDVAMPINGSKKERELKLDSPFIFVIYNRDMPVYMGFVENPSIK